MARFHSQIWQFQKSAICKKNKFYTGTFDLLVFKVILGSFGALVSKGPITRKQMSVEKRSEIWKSGVGVNMYMGYLLVFKIILGF